MIFVLCCSVMQYNALCRKLHKKCISCTIHKVKLKCIHTYLNYVFMFINFISRASRGRATAPLFAAAAATGCPLCSRRCASASKQRLGREVIYILDIYTHISNIYFVTYLYISMSSFSFIQHIACVNGKVTRISEMMALYFPTDF